MKLRSLQFKGFSSSFPDVVTLSFKDLEGSLIAPVGPNGVGKTTILEAFPGALYRHCPSRRTSPIDLAISRDSFIDVEFESGDAVYRARLSMDGQTRKMDALLEQLQPDGTRLRLNDGKASTFDDVVERRFPSLELFINSAFAAQGRGDEFARATPAKRKDLFAELLSLGRLLQMAEIASKARALCLEAKGRLDTAVATIDVDLNPRAFDALDQWANELQVRGGQAELRARELVDIIAGLEAQDTLSADATAAYAAAQYKVATVNRELTLRREERQQVESAQRGDHAAHQRELARLEGEREATLTRLEQGDVAAVRQQRAADVAGADAEAQAITKKRDDAFAELERRISANQQILDAAVAIRTAVAEQQRLSAELDTCRAQERATQEERDRLGRDLAVAEQRVSSFAVPQAELTASKKASALLTTVPCHGVGDFAACQFLLDAAAAQQRIAVLEAQLAGVAAAIALRDELQAKTTAVDAALRTIRASLQTLQTAFTAHAEHASRAGDLAEAEVRIAGYRSRRHEIEAEAPQRLQAVRDRLEARMAELEAREQDLERRRVDIQEASAARQAEEQRRWTARLTEHTGRLRDIDAAIARLDADLAAATADLTAAATGNTQATHVQQALAEARAERDRVQQALGEVTSSREELARQRHALQAKRARRATLLRKLQRVETEMLEWSFLRTALGKGGLPDLEIDAAGPTISALTNQLLHACYGPRFTLELVTQVERADGSGLRDEFTVRVLDNEKHGGWRDIGMLSGGQKVVVQEALMCAIALYMNERSSTPMRTLFRDESGAALDAENAPAYIAMLRKVAAIGGFDHVFYVSHNADVQALADVQIRIADGQAVLRRRPFQEAA